MNEIEIFIENNKKPYKQGSTNHIEFRKQHIGCSELKKALGTLNMVKTIMKNKTSVGSFNILAITHGVHFEDNCEEFVRDNFSSQIYKAPGSVTNPNLPYIACSADGLGYINVTNFDKYKKINGKLGIETVSITPKNYHLLSEFILLSSDKDKEINEALFEYKSPYSRELKDFYISDDYEYQIQGGCQVIDICKYACFFEGVFKQCTIYDFFDNDYNMVNSALYNKNCDKIDLARGIKLYFIHESLYQKYHISIKLNNTLRDFDNCPFYETFGIDFGRSEYFKYIFMGLNESFYKIVNIPMFYRTDYEPDLSGEDAMSGEFYNKSGNRLDQNYVMEQILHYINLSEPELKQEGYMYIGFVCWKMYDFQFLIEKKKNIIGDRELARCRSIMECINSLRSDDNSFVGGATIDNKLDTLKINEETNECYF